MNLRIFLAVLFALLMNASMNGANYFSMRTASTTPSNGTLHIPPACLGDVCPVWVTANFDGYLDHWFVQFTHSDKMPLDNVSSGADMVIPYTNRDGNLTWFTAVFSANAQNAPSDAGLLYSTFSASSTVYGYWDPDNDGHYDMYGTVKWESGYHDDMFRFDMAIPADFTMDTVTIACTLSSTTDWRGCPTVSGNFTSKLCLKVGWPGDVNDDCEVNVEDVTALIAALLASGTSISELADMDGDGTIDVTDVTLLIDYVLTH